VCLETITGKLCGGPVAAIVEHATKFEPINAGWIIKIKFTPALRRKMRTIAIKVVQREVGRFAPQRSQ
jgi:hypothetical protein